MNFKEFLEAFDTFADKEVYVRHQGNDHSSFFDVDNVTYEVRFSKQSSALTDKEYEVLFFGPNRLMPTDMGKPTRVYSGVLHACKKLVEELLPDIMSFRGYTGGMQLVYSRFVKKFLTDAPDKDPRYIFFEWRPGVYLNKDFYQSLSPEMKRLVDSDRQEITDDHLKNIRQDRADSRVNASKSKVYIGGFVRTIGGKDGIVTGVGSNGINYVVLGNNTLTKGVGNFPEAREDQYFTPNEFAIEFPERCYAVLSVLFGFDPTVKHTLLNMLPKQMRELESIYNRMRQRFTSGGPHRR